MNIAGVTCTRCKKDVVFPDDGEMWCECGFTFVRKDRATGDYAFGGPGDPRTFTLDQERKRIVITENSGGGKITARTVGTATPLRASIGDLVKVRKRNR